MLDIQIANNIDLKSRSLNFAQGTIVLKKGKCYISKAYPLFYKGTILTKENVTLAALTMVYPLLSFTTETILTKEKCTLAALTMAYPLFSFTTRTILTKEKCNIGGINKGLSPLQRP